MSSSPLVNSLVKNQLQDRTRHRWAAISIHPHYGFVCGRHDAAWHPRSRNPQDWYPGCLEATCRLDVRKFGVSWPSSLTVAHARRGVPVHCPILEQSHYQTLCVSLAAVWRHYDVVKQHQSVSDITRISCFVTTTKLPHALQIYSTVYVKFMRLHFSR